MAFDIKQHVAVDRPTIRSGRSASSNLPALVEEVKPLLAEALQLPADKALPVVVPAEQAADLVRALRAAGDEANVTVRFKRFPRLDENGEQIIRYSKDDGRPTEVSDPFEYTSKNRQNVRITFWTGKKIERKAKSAPMTDWPQPTI